MERLISETTQGPKTRLEPWTSWTVVTDSPLRGLCFAREAGVILAWDEGNQLYLLNTRGESQSFSRAPNRITAGAISDDGSLIALLVEATGAELLLLSSDFEVRLQRAAPSESSFLSIDPHGRYLAIGGRQRTLHLITRNGRPAGRLEVMEPLSHLCFIPDRPLLVGAAAYGMVVGVALEAGRNADRLDPEILWQDRLTSNVGRLAASGDGSIILASCFTLGIQRFDLRGRNEGSYHLGGTVSQAVTDFPGRTMAATTLEGDLAVLSPSGHVRWRTTLERPASALEIDPLGRYLIHGRSTGEISRLDLFGGESEHAEPRTARPAAHNAPGSRAGSGTVRQPDWVIPFFERIDQAETAVLAVLDLVPTIAVFSTPSRLSLFDATGKIRASGLEVGGAGRILRTAQAWIAAATDRRIMLYDARSGSHHRLDASLVELTHLEIRPDDYGVAVVQERDRIGRLTPSGKWIWKHELKDPIEDIAISRDEDTAITTDAGEFIVFDPEGTPHVGFRFDPTDPPLVIDAAATKRGNTAWISLARRAQQLRGHDRQGKVVWELPMPWEGWALERLGALALATSADGRLVACDSTGQVRDQSNTPGEPGDLFYLDAARTPARLSRKGVHLISSTLAGAVNWRSVADDPIGPRAAGQSGIAVVLGKSLAWFANELHSPSTDSKAPGS